MEDLRVFGMIDMLSHFGGRESGVVVAGRGAVLGLEEGEVEVEGFSGVGGW